MWVCWSSMKIWKAVYKPDPERNTNSQRLVHLTAQRRQHSVPRCASTKEIFLNPCVPTNADKIAKSFLSSSNWLSLILVAFIEIFFPRDMTEKSVSKALLTPSCNNFISLQLCLLRVTELNWSLSLIYMMFLCNTRTRFSTFLQLKYFSLGEQSPLNQSLSRAASRGIVSSLAMLPSSVSLIWELFLCPKPALIFSVGLSWIKGLHIPSVVCTPAAFETHWVFYIGHN